MSDIAVQKTKEDSASKSLQITVPADRVRQAEARALKYYSQQAKLPGFRQGKAPEAIVRKRFGDAIRQTVLEEMIRESWETAKSSEALKPVTEPHVHNLKFEEGGPIEFEFHVEVKPEIKLARTGGFTLRRQVAPLLDSDIDDRLRGLREQRAAWLPVEGARPGPGQMVRVEVASLTGDRLGASQPYEMVLGEGRAIPELEERIMTLLPGETTDAEVKFPDDHPDATKRGQARQVRITLHEVKRQELPAADDALAREVGEFENLDALRAALRADLATEREHEADRDVRQALVQQIVQANNVEAPASLVERFLRGYAQIYQVADEQMERFAAEFRPLAEGQVRRDLVLDAVVEANGLTATEAELDERVARVAAARNLPPAQLYASLQKSNRLAELERSIIEEKAFAHLLQQSTVEEGTA